MKKVIVVALMVFGICGFAGTKELNDAKAWKPIGATPIEVVFDQDENAIRFDVAIPSKEYKDVYPGFSVKKGSLSGVSGITFEMKTVAVDGWIGNVGRIIVPRQEKHSGVFEYAPAINDTWKSVTVKFDALSFNTAEVSSIQISIGGKCAGFKCYLRNITLLDKDGKPIDELAKYSN